MLLVMAVARFFSGGVAVVMYFRFGGWRHIFPWWVLWLRRRKYIWCSSLWLTRGSTDFSSQRTLKPTYERQAVDRSGVWCLRRLSCFSYTKSLSCSAKIRCYHFFIYLIIKAKGHKGHLDRHVIIRNGVKKKVFNISKIAQLQWIWSHCFRYTLTRVSTEIKAPYWANYLPEVYWFHFFLRHHVCWSSGRWKPKKEIIRTALCSVKYDSCA